MTSVAHLPSADYLIEVQVKPRSPQSEASAGEAVAHAAHALEQALAKIAPVILQVQQAQSAQRMEQLAALLLGDQGPTPIDIARARMKAEARRATYQGTEWLTAAQLAELAGLGRANPSATVNRWKQQGKVFAITRHAQDLYPRYLFDESFRPLAGAGPVLQALSSFGTDRLASWFESRTGLLNGRRPRELLATDPAGVLEAAQRTRDAGLHAA